MKPVKLAVVLSDIHCGSTVGLMPPNFVTAENQEISQNPIQRWLWDCWRRAQDFAGKIAGGDPYALLLNGDLIEGIHHGTKQVISPDVKDHVGAAEQALEPFVKNAECIFVVRGTECHTNNHELTLGKILGGRADPDSNPKKPLHAFDRLQLDIHGCPCALSHHIGTSVRDYTEATQLSVVLNQELVNAQRNGERTPKVVVRAHRHRFGFFGNGHELCFVTPPWQAQTRHVHKVVTSTRCHPGILILDWREKERGELPAFHSKIYEAPKQTFIGI